MCGIAGFLADPSRRTSIDQLKSIADAMDVSLEHRGPDDHGVWVDAEAGIALVHRRLSIVDLSPAGHQPMHSADGRFVMVYNGEVYSHLPIRAEIEATGHRFRGHSDTEVLLESFARYGIRATADRLIGMFAIAIWDRQQRTLKLIRDRLGIKPIYWAKIGGLFMFGSELKALRQHPGWTPRIEPAAVASFMRHNYIPAPHTIYRDVYKLEPGTILTLEVGREPQTEKFWDARQVALDGLSNPLTGNEASLVEQLETLLVDAVRKRTMADVPLGAFLSGGVDSSTVVALMKAANVGPVKTFSIGFEQKAFNEAPHAAAIARHLGTDHTELIVTSQEALEVVPKLSEIFDEPFADSSQIPTYLVSAMTRKHVTVALSGDGGDELFSGYNRYQLTRRSWRMLSLVPTPVRKAVAAGLTSVSSERWNALFDYLPEHSYPRLPGDKIHKFANVLGLNDADELYRKLISHWDPAGIAPGVAEARGVLWDSSVRADFPNLLDRMQFLDSVTYLPDDILTKVDRASMAVALEARVPLLDHRVVEMAWRLPHSVKIRRGVSKWLLRQVLYRHVPRNLIERPKMGFTVPLDQWLRGPLRQWAENLLSEKRLRETDFFDVALIRRHWTEHLSRERNWQYALWDVLMFEAWRERWG
ncbi:asparagine synthase (glutamine-hydrolyzing) [Bradyrhizobium elkanii]|uniref:asparagine synthase (glutamine-hydrolyzing) n=1 Tax=Bradyrhizobium elkanii TaxID=29448 RepID=A0ABV4F5Q7_BRAEL|nr:asparagine synthase (glutamine-hydrolyzing) [Bradyrhizobium elkanii]MCP1750203.1 asparagine synthase (glutamine-hydrolyzing) [Bradyrhizobium elkanii]MCP1984776.1 asparagine synthase (glutamine-hydrolyzing) [Bradyrhizobium elkanii]MCS3889505.1 asparagine synthase (glutamine-hydrolyzing) [Bradyrhizobium elkanii]MCS4211474.1 asparagine synthase (glutamine-hydrolyzing) [Bradyrhizobium elkanii]MCW2192894.1 asparagine synthase (glutamine-hydrolyzing) [Bradyrhizobium elkanii]